LPLEGESKKAWLSHLLDVGIGFASYKLKLWSMPHTASKAV